MISGGFISSYNNNVIAATDIMTRRYGRSNDAWQLTELLWRLVYRDYG